MARFKRILLKLSGESLMGQQGFGIDPDRLADYANQIKEIHAMGVQIGIVIERVRPCEGRPDGNVCYGY